MLPETESFQGGVLFLGDSCGLPVIAAAVGELRKDIIEGGTGFLCQPRSSECLVGAIAHGAYRRLAEHYKLGVG